MAAVVPVEEVHAISISESGLERRVDDKMAEITLQDGAIVGVGCVASINGSPTAPELEIAIGDEDKTEDSVAMTNLTSYSSEGDLTVYKSEQKLTMIFDKVDPAHSRKMLKCIAKAKGYEETTETFLIKVRCEYQTGMFIKAILDLSYLFTFSYSNGIYSNDFNSSDFCSAIYHSVQDISLHLLSKTRPSYVTRSLCHIYIYLMAF